MKDIAKLAGVSTNTVSRALNGKKEISEKTQNRIKEIAKELNLTKGRVSQLVKALKQKV